MTPERARGWLSTIYPIFEKGTPVTLLFLTLVIGIFGWVMRNEIRRLHDVNNRLWVEYTAEQKAHLALALKCQLPP